MGKKILGGGGGGSAPQQNPEIARLADQLSKFGDRLFTMGDEQYERALQIAADYGDDIDQIIDNLDQYGEVMTGIGEDQLRRYDSQYRPIENLQTIYGAGGNWLNEDARNAMYDEMEQVELDSLQDAFLAESSGMSNAEYQAKRNEIIKGGDYAKALMGVQDAAEANAESRAHGDVASAESRHRQSLTATAGRMGIDPSRVMAGAAEDGADLAAVAVGAGNRARFGVRDQIKFNTDRTVDTGRRIQATGVNALSRGADAENIKAGHHGNKANVDINAPISSTAFYGPGMTGTAGAGNLYNAEYANRIREFNANEEQRSGLFESLGTVAGLGIKAYGISQGIPS